MATLYVEVGFSSLHQKRPADYQSSGPYLSVGGVSSSISKYGLVPGYGDPGENPSYDNFDYPEFSIVGASFIRPANFGEQGQYTYEGNGGTTHQGNFAKYRIVTVPDTFQIPAGLPSISGGAGGGTAVFGDPSSFFQTDSSDGSFNFQWSIFYAKASPVSAKEAVDEAVHDTFHQILTSIFGSGITGAIENVQSAKAAINSVATQNYELVQFGIENFDALSPERFRAATDRTWGASQEILVDELATQLRAHFPEAPSVVINLPGYSVSAGIDWATPAAELIAGGMVLSVTGVRGISNGQTVDHQGRVHYGTNFYYRSEESDLVVSYNSVGVVIDTLGGDDVILTGSGRDQIFAGGGNDRIDAGGGLDVVEFSSSRSAYSLIPMLDNTIQIRDGTGQNGADLLRDVERLQFTDGVLALDIGGNAGNAYRLYQAAFNRTPDQPGVSFWTHQLDLGTDIQAVAQGFVNAAEFRSVYGSNPTNTHIVDLMYQNVLGRAGEPAGINFWVGQLDNGLAIGALLQGFAASSENHGRVDPVIALGISLDQTASLYH